MSDASEDLLEAFPTRRPDRSSQLGYDPEDNVSKCRTSSSAHSRKTRRKGGLSRNRSERFRRHRSFDDVTDITNEDSKNPPGTHGLVKRRYHNGIITVVDGFNSERGCQPTRDQTLVDFSDHNRTNSNLEMAESTKSGSVDDSGGEVFLSPSVPLKHATSGSSLPGTIDASSGARSLSSMDVDPNPIVSAKDSRQECSTVISTTSSTDKDNTKVGTGIATETSPNGANLADSLESESDEEESSFEEETSSSQESSTSSEEPQSESAANVIAKEFNTHDQTMNISDFDEDEINKSVTTAESDNTPITSRKQCSNDAKESFTADSPYFTAYVDREMGNLNVLTDTLRDISARARDFGECGALMADATRKLSLSCKLHPTYDDPALDEETREREKNIVARRKESVGQEMGSVLRILGEVLDEIADAQSQMCESLEASLSLTLDAFANVESEESTRLRSEADLMSASSEAQFAKYLQRGVKVTSSSNDARVNGVTDEINASVAAVSSNWNKLSDSMNLSLKGWSNRDGRDINDRNKRGNSRTPFGASNGSGSGTAATSSDSNNLIHTAVAASSIRQMLEEIRLSQANSELKRFQLLKRLESLKTRRNFELGESALASLNGIRAYFHHCSDLTQGLAPRLKRAQVGQIDAREKHDAQQVPWDIRQKGLTNAISEVGVAAANAGVIADAISRGQATGFGASMIADQPTTLAEIENEVQLWELPRLLAESSFYHREPTPGVSVEGWLYKRSTNRISTSWNKRWFILDKTGVYYLREGQRSSGANSSSRERIKVCDILICTVREVPENAKGNQGCRFCFEILSPNSRPHMLQACGPIEFKRWVNGIRNCIECQLVSGNLPPAGLLPKSSQRGVDSSLESVEKADLDSPGNYGEESFVDLLQSSVMLNSTEKGSHPSSQSNVSKGFFPEAGNINNKSVNAAGQNIARKALVQEILHANPYCADCGRPSPDWASLNLGVLLCIECSGVHRSMGVHVSKVRSVTLDALTESEARLLLIIGNERANKIWEAGVYSQTGWNKPDPSDDRKKKEDWIKSKYQWSGFLDYKKEDGAGEEREKKFSMDLYEAAKAGHILGVAEALAKGGNVEWKNELEDSKTPLHICAVGIDDSHYTDEVVDETDTNESNDKKLREEKRSFDRIACAELLLQNGAKLDAQDKSHLGVLDCAVCGNAERYMIEYLTSKTKSL